MAVVFVISLLVFRGLYGVVPFLLTLAIASILAYGTVICLRLWRAGRVRLNNLELKAANRVTKTGFIFLTLAGGMGCLLLHSALVRYHEFRGMRSFQRVHAMADGGLTVAGHPEYASAIRHHGFLEKWSLVRSIELSRRQAALCLMGLDGAGAERHLGRILARMPGDVDARLGWVRAKLLGGRVPEARSALGALSGISLAGAGDTETRRVRVEIDELKAQVALATGDLESAILAYQAALAVTGPGHQSARIHGAIGELFAGRGELTAALEHMEIAVAGRPNSSAAHYNLAVVLGAAGRLSESEEHYRRAIELDPTDVEPVNNLGMLLAGRGDLDSADERFRAAIALRADFAPAHFNHARVLVARGKWEEARQHLVRAAQLDARFAEFTSSGMLPPF
jgi:Flp pilus assembly protein TadD